MPQLSQDKVGSDSLVGTTASLYGSLDQTQVSSVPSGIAVAPMLTKPHPTPEPHQLPEQQVGQHPQQHGSGIGLDAHLYQVEFNLHSIVHHIHEVEFNLYGVELNLHEVELHLYQVDLDLH